MILSCFEVTRGVTTTYTQTSSAGANGNDQWSISTNWSGGAPAGAVDASIPDKASAFTVAVNSASTATYNGGLYLGTNVQLRVTWTTGIAQNVNALGTPGQTIITMGANSSINYRNGTTVNPLVIPAISLQGNAAFINQQSTQQASNPNFEYAITGPHTFTLDGGSGTSTLKAANSFASLNVVNGVTAVGAVNGSFGTGDVSVSGTSKLTFGSTDAIADSASLRLNGSLTSARITMNASDSVGGLYLNGAKQLPGTYTSSSSWVAGTGTLTVLGAASSYWDPAVTSGTWSGASPVWFDNASGTGATSGWTAGRNAVFSAGGTATGTTNVTVSGTQDIAGLGFEDGDVTVVGDSLRILGETPVIVAAGRTASINSVISQDAAGRALHKSGTGSLILGGANTFTGAILMTEGFLELANSNASAGVATVGGGTLRLSHANALDSAASLSMANGTSLQLRSGSNATFGPTTLDAQLPVANNAMAIDVGGSGSGHSLTIGTFNRRNSANTAATLNVTGSNGYSLAITAMNLTGGNSLTLNPTTANLSIGPLAATTGTTTFSSANNITLTLGGNAGTNNSITSIIETSGAGQQLIIAKNTAATWTLGDVNVKSGNGHTVTAGTLNLNGTFEWTSTNTDRKLTVSGGQLNLNTATAIKTLNGNLIMTGGALDNISGAAIAMTSNPNMQWGGNWAFVGSNGGNSSLNIGTGTVAITGATRTVDVQNAAAAFTVGGGISGTGFGITKAGAGRLVLRGNNTYSGPTTVNQGVLSIDGSGGINSSAVTINGGTFRYNSSTNYSNTLTFTSGTIGGTNLGGSLAGLTIGSGQILSPGNSPGTASTVSQTWAGGGTYVWEINDATGTAGSDPGWDLLSGTGTLDISASSGSRFTILVTSLGLTNVAGNAANFSDNVSSKWLIANFATLTNFSTDAFTVDTSVFTNPFTGTFAVARGDTVTGGTSNQVYVTYSAVVPEPSTLALAAVGLAAAGWHLRRRRR